MASSPKRNKQGVKVLKVDFAKEFEARGLPLEAVSLFISLWHV